MNFGTIPDSLLTIDLARAAGPAAYLVLLAVVVGIALGVAILCSLARCRLRAVR
jgi:hypothetical protein